jgi:hypothetical protein
MGHGRRLRLSCRYLILIALAIQGVTPDSRDLASINALKLLCPVLRQSDQPLDADDFPDDVCEPLQIERDASRFDSRNWNESRFLSLITTDSRSATVIFDPFQFVRRSGALVPVRGRVQRLAPFIC